MLRGFLSGAFWGAILIAILMGFVSLLAPLPSTVDPQTSTAETTAGSNEEGSGNIGSVSQADEAVEEGGSVAVDTPDADDASPLIDTESAPQPNPDAPTPSMTAPETGETTPTVSAEADAPVGAATHAPTPDAPEAPELTPDSITSNPAQPTAPTVTDEGAFATPEPAQDADVSPVAEMQEGAQGGTQGEILGETQGGLPATESLLKPSGDIKQKFAQHGSDRLPTVGNAENPEATDGAAATPANMQSVPPFVANAVAFSAAGDKPLMAIVLMDDGAPEIDPEALQNFPYPLSIAINTLAPDVAERVKLYQGMGFEILAMIDMPAVAAASDVEVALDAHLGVIPQAVAVMEGAGDGLQGTKVISDQVTAVLADSGHGLLLFQRGLNTAQKLASREGVAAASVFRDFDGKGQSASVIRRFLDQAAFRAEQDGGVIMVGRLREETLSALLVWGLQDRAGSVALTPVSVVITAKQP